MDLMLYKTRINFKGEDNNQTGNFRGGYDYIEGVLRGRFPLSRTRKKQ